MKNKLEPKRVSTSEKHRNAGRLGGLQTWLRFGSDHLQEIARHGGRPTRQEAAEKAWRTYILCRERAGQRGKTKEVRLAARPPRRPAPEREKPAIEYNLRFSLLTKIIT